MEDMLVQRVLRKSQRVLEVWESVGRDWNQTLYRMSAYAMGAPRNSRPMEQLASRVTFSMCVRERDSIRRVEALLLGCSGVLNMEFFDDYILALQQDFDYLASKYQLRSMNAGAWDRSNLLPAANPVMRIAQFAALVARSQFVLDELLRIATLEDVERFFDVAASEYWHSRCLPDGKKYNGTGRLGRQKVYMLAINLVVPMQFAYASVTGKVGLKEQAMAFLEAIPAEQNRVVGGWTGYGVPCTSAYDSQALLELSALCERGGCGECPLGKMIEKRRLKL
jgi:hypothetical protein